MNKIATELQEKLKKQRKKYQKVTELADQLPMFRSKILECEIDGSRPIPLTSSYKGIFFDWGIKLYTAKPVNYHGEYNGQRTVSVYCNCYTLFDSSLYDFASKKLDEKMVNVPMLHNDVINSTFYFELHQAENGLDRISEWYNEVKEQGQKVLIEQRKAELKKQLKELEQQ